MEMNREAMNLGRQDREEMRQRVPERLHLEAKLQAAERRNRRLQTAINPLRPRDFPLTRRTLIYRS